MLDGRWHSRNFPNGKGSILTCIGLGAKDGKTKDSDAVSDCTPPFAATFVKALNRKARGGVAKIAKKAALRHRLKKPRSAWSLVIIIITVIIIANCSWCMKGCLSRSQHSRDATVHGEQYCKAREV
jgi:hypothetical protein